MFLSELSARWLLLVHPYNLVEHPFFFTSSNPITMIVMASWLNNHTSNIEQEVMIYLKPGVQFLCQGSHSQNG
jgi:hypothetical protein